MHRLKHLIAAATAALALGGPAHAQSETLVQVPFDGSALTQAQLEAWDAYLAHESGKFGCSYGDDPRLIDDPAGTLVAVRDDPSTPPVQVTLRTLLTMPREIREILGRNMVIASMDCQPVFFFQSSVTGAPVIPFEEYLSLLANFASPRGEGAMDAVLKTARVAPIDVRWYMGYFLLAADNVSLLGYSTADLERVYQLMPDIIEETAFFPPQPQQIGLYRPPNYDVEGSVTQLHRIYARLPGAALTLPVFTPCEVIGGRLPYEITVSPEDDAIMTNEERRDDVAVIEAERRFLEKMTRYVHVNLAEPFEDTTRVRIDNDDPVANVPFLPVNRNNQPAGQTYYTVEGKCQ